MNQTIAMNLKVKHMVRLKHPLEQRNILQRKVFSRSGETITEVLVASLVIAFGSIILATMVVASTRIIKKSTEAYGQYMVLHNEMEMLDANGRVGDEKTFDGDLVYISAYGSLHEYGNGKDLNTSHFTISEDLPYQESVKIYAVPKTENGAVSKWHFLKYFVN